MLPREVVRTVVREDSASGEGGVDEGEVGRKWTDSAEMLCEKRA